MKKYLFSFEGFLEVIAENDDEAFEKAWDKIFDNTTEELNFEGGEITLHKTLPL